MMLSGNQIEDGWGFAQPLRAARPGVAAVGIPRSSPPEALPVPKPETEVLSFPVGPGGRWSGGCVSDFWNWSLAL